jgi:phospholipid N-methyltransferase
MKTHPSIKSTHHNPMMSFDLDALRASLDVAKDDLYNMVFSEMPVTLIVSQQAKIRALKSRITKLGNQQAFSLATLKHPRA